jgi:ribosomal subunit interface protein
MDIRINSVRFDHSEQLEEFIQKKVGKLDKYYEGIINVDVILRVVKPESSINKKVELKVNVPNTELFADKTADSFEEALDLTIDAVKKQLKKHKEKLKR